MTFRWETANTCAVHLVTAPASLWRKIFISKATQRSWCHPLQSLLFYLRDPVPQGRHLHLSHCLATMETKRCSYSFLHIENQFLVYFPVPDRKTSGVLILNLGNGATACLRSPAHAKIHLAATVWLPPGSPHLIWLHCAYRAGEVLLYSPLPAGCILRARSNSLWWLAEQEAKRVLI